jgi:serine/threonine-protein kinase
MVRLELTTLCLTDDTEDFDMDSSISVLSVSVCPARDTLAAFHLGLLDEDALDALAEHIDVCPPCRSALDTLQSEQSTDRLLGKLRQCEETPAAMAEDGCVRLEEAACAMPLAANVSTPAVPRDVTVETVDSKPARTRPLPAAIASYEILARIGEGGMGVVYKARQQPLQRLVALKTISAGLHAGTHALMRFRVEGQAIARLRHPHVVQIYDFDEHEGMPFYSMELLEGGSLSHRLTRGPLEPDAAAALVQTLAEAVAYAHQENVVHRDLKPGNILLTEAGEPKIADFGLAKLLDSDDGHTCSEATMGTPSYMAPEQAAGRSAEVGPAADIYALGAILYQTLTSEPPFQGKDRDETLRQVREKDPVAPSRLRSAVPRELEAICLKCLAKTPAQRYLSAHALADDLGRWRRGEPTVARPPRWPAWLGHLLRRAVVVLGVLVIVGAVSLAVLHFRDPQRIVERLQRELDQGRAVTLLGATGMPAWYRWRAGESKSGLGTAKDGSLSVSTWAEVALLELLPEIGGDRYRLTAQVRHFRSDKLAPSGCGLFFVRRTAAPPHADVQFCVAMHFDDIYAPEDKKPPFKRPPGHNTVRLGTRYLIDKNDYTYLHLQLAWRGGAYFLPAGPGATPPWHTLEVDVSPEAYRARWDDLPLDTLTADWSLRRAGATLKGYRQDLPEHSALVPDVPRGFATRGGLGLYVGFSSATFREVVVTPLDWQP